MSLCSIRGAQLPPLVSGVAAQLHSRLLRGQYGPLNRLVAANLATGTVCSGRGSWVPQRRDAT